MGTKKTFLARFQAYALEKNICLHARTLSPKMLAISPTIYWEEQKNNDLRLVRSIILRYVEDDISEALNGNGEAYMGGSDEHMAPYNFEKLDINIPFDDVDIGQVWKLYHEWLIKWTPAEKLRELVKEPIRGGNPKKGTE